MVTSKTRESEHSIASFEALKTAIANDETSLVKELLGGQAMQQLEKNYLLELARLGTNQDIIRLLEAVPVQRVTE